MSVTTVFSPFVEREEKKPLTLLSLFGALMWPATIVSMAVFILLGTVYFGRVSSLAPSDDALIGLRPAEVFWQTGVLSFNSTERVEANSSLLYTLLAVPGFAFLDRLDVIFYYLPMLNSIFALLTALGLYRLCKTIGVNDIWARLTAVFWAVVPVTSFWAASAMETTFNSMLEVWFIVIVVTISRGESQKTITLPTLFVMTLLLLATRPDGFIVPLCSMVFLVISKGERRAGLSILASLIGGLAVLMLWRFFYYGQPFPNPVYVKMAGTLNERFHAGWFNWKRIFIPSGLWLVLLPLFIKFFLEVAQIVVNIGAVVRSQRWSNVFSHLNLAPWLACSLIVYWFLHAGDAYGERQLLTLFPLGIAEWVMFAHSCWQKNLKQGIVVLPVVAVVLFLPVTDFKSLYDFRGGDIPPQRFIERDLNIVKALKHDYPGFQSIAADKLGFIGYLVGPEVRVDDFLGLADVHVAHQPRKYTPNGGFVPAHCKYDLDYSLGVRKPDVVYVVIFEATNMSHYFIQGLDRNRLEAEGYELAYLSTWQGNRCVNVRGDEEKAQRLLSLRYYNIALFVKKTLKMG